MPSIQEYAAVCFGESNKSSKKEFEKDCTGSIWVVKNRLNHPNPNRFPDPTEGFSSVGGDEYKKFMTGTLTKEEEWFAKKAYQIAGGVERGLIPDPINGADHMGNIKLDADQAWMKLKNENSVPIGNMYYPETYSTKSHSFRKETLRRRKPARAGKKK